MHLAGNEKRVFLLYFISLHFRCFHGWLHSDWWLFDYLNWVNQCMFWLSKYCDNTSPYLFDLNYSTLIPRNLRDFDTFRQTFDGTKKKIKKVLLLIITYNNIKTICPSFQNQNLFHKVRRVAHYANRWNEAFVYYFRCKSLLFLALNEWSWANFAEKGIY